MPSRVSPELLTGAGRTRLPAVPRFTLLSNDLVHGSPLPAAHAASGAGGRNLSPHLAWHGHPADTASFAVTCYDPDAPTGSGIWHWIVVDVSADVTELPTGAAGIGTVVANDLGNPGYDGAAPPPGRVHRYAFTVHALDVARLDLAGASTSALARFRLNAHSIARASLYATFPSRAGDSR